MNTILAEKRARALLLPVCAICGEVPEHGISGGYMLNKSFICNKCEQRIINTEIGTSQYQEILQLIKKIIR
ncbi:MAG TPA: sigma factor G inhibitor Gin [Syntrophomonadaceae bacterium]|nr:sigma factor G inhibitor Gin [Syntrophomonadaceae bacterium]